MGRFASLPCGHSRCRICGKPVPSAYRCYHEKVACLKMSFDRGDPDVVARVLSKALPKPVRVLPSPKLPERGQLQLFAVAGVA